MQVKIAKIAKRPVIEGRKGRVIPLPSKGIPVVTEEDRAQVAAAAKRRNHRLKYPVFQEP